MAAPQTRRYRPRGLELLELDALLAGCRIEKRGGRLFAAPAVAQPVHA
jgi:hypothetical protein